jgi:hypothetical protein
VDVAFLLLAQEALKAMTGERDGLKAAMADMKDRLTQELEAQKSAHEAMLHDQVGPSLQII